MERAAEAFGADAVHPISELAERLPAALIQGQRDFFGAHTYRRTDADAAVGDAGGAERAHQVNRSASSVARLMHSA